MIGGESVCLTTDDLRAIRKGNLCVRVAMVEASDQWARRYKLKKKNAKDMAKRADARFCCAGGIVLCRGLPVIVLNAQALCAWKRAKKFKTCFGKTFTRVEDEDVQPDTSDDSDSDDDSDNCCEKPCAGGSCIR